MRVPGEARDGLADLEADVGVHQAAKPCARACLDRFAVGALGPPACWTLPMAPCNLFQDEPGTAPGTAP